jgi:PadR family transcriptional regulator, regulatory protein AphA
MNRPNKNIGPPEKGRNPVEYLILGALAGGPLHGYDLYQYLEGHLGRIWTMGRSQTYALLSRMEQAGLVSHERQAQEKRPDRKVFSLTPAGRKEFTAWVKTPVEHVRDLRLEFLAKMHFLEKGDRKFLGKLIESQQQICREKLSHLEERKRSASSGMERMGCDFRQALARAALEWLEVLKTKGKDAAPEK